MTNKPAVYSYVVTKSDTIQLKGTAAFFYIYNAGAAMETVTLRSVVPMGLGSLGKTFDTAFPIPAGVMVPIYQSADYVMETGTGADITAIACYT